MRIEIPEIAVVALVGASGSGKSAFARRYFKQTEVLSSDYFRALISDDENNQKVSAQAFETLYYVAAKRLELGFLTVIDATNVQKEARASVLRLAKEQNCQAAAIVLDLPAQTCRERNEKRSDRNFGGHVVTRQSEQLRRSLKHLAKEGFRCVYVLKTEEEIDSVEIVRKPLWNNKKDETGPFDMIGDIHGCYDELCALLDKLGYEVNREDCAAVPPEGRKAIFLGDLCDRGPENVAVLRLVMNMTRSGAAYCVAGNHDVKLLRKLRGAGGQLTHGLDKTIAQLETQNGEFIADVKTFLDSLISHYVLDGGKLVAAHAGLKEKYQGRASGRVREFCLYGDTTGETDEYGLPVRLPWANEYRGKAAVVYGHTPTPDVEAINNTFCIDTGCVFGGKLTAFRYPEKEIVQVGAAREYYPPAKPFPGKPLPDDDILTVADVLERRYLATRLRRSVKIDPENSAAALEVMSRFAADPHWLIYLPPTMSPCETSKLPDYLEYPTEAFDYYKTRGVGRVVCEQKHMGSRAVIVLCRDEETAIRRFQADGGAAGIIYTRTGRRFFEDDVTESALLERLRAALTASGFWRDLHTDWVCLDTELMPWSAKAQKLLEEQYAPVGLAGRRGLASATDAINKAAAALGHSADAQKQDLDALLQRCGERAEALDLYTEAYRRYCWDVKSLDDYRIAPFHILAAEGGAWCGENHLRHMEIITKYITGTDPIFMATDHMLIDLLDENSVAAGVKWWEDLTAAGGEGMVVKPYDFIASKGSELLQPAVKCRGREYLRIIYGPEYMLADNLARLKKRSLAKKRNLALNEFALGVESLERFARHEPLYRVHECVFGVLAMESEPVDPRL
ncbi:MAG: polynucleotide kinase-phosphatase [Gracilibacteraceae bacterium]|jgi:protein phosphatase|nr:polynucleotide kinase-phosphatase [Gracilibacteraceae bacterium]